VNPAYLKGKPTSISTSVIKFSKTTLATSAFTKEDLTSLIAEITAVFSEVAALSESKYTVLSLNKAPSQPIS